jgi:hypothetical protein
VHAVALTLFVSAVLAALAVGLFVWTHRERTREHVDRLALLPLDDDVPSSKKADEAHSR